MVEMSQIASDHRLTYQPRPVDRNFKSGLEKPTRNNPALGRAAGPRFAGQVSHMEHRMFQRKPVSVDVIVYKDELAICASQTRDLSLNGLFF